MLKNRVHNVVGIGVQNLGRHSLNHLELQEDIGLSGLFARFFAAASHALARSGATCTLYNEATVPKVAPDVGQGPAPAGRHRHLDDVGYFVCWPAIDVLALSLALPV